MESQPPSGKFAILLSLHENIQPTEFILQKDVCTIGRSSTCDIVVAQRTTISRLHAKIETEGPRYFLRDANSANGTFVNERRIRNPHLLQDDDMIGLGMPQAILRFSDPDPTDIVQDQLRYDERAMLFFLNQQQIDLTPNEFRLLHYLHQHISDVCTRKSCAEAIWNREYDPGPDDEGLDRIISNIRGKLRRLNPSIDPANIIKTRRGLGYQLDL